MAAGKKRHNDNEEVIKMALIKKNFEQMDTDTGSVEANDVVEAKVEAKVEVAQAPKQASTPTPAAVATASTTAVAPAKSTFIDPFEDLEGKMSVRFDTLLALKATNGNLLQDQTVLGDTVGMEILSTQKLFVISPGDDDDEASKHVRYSDDGVTTSQGENCKEYLEALTNAGYVNARMTERLVIVGDLFDAGKGKGGPLEDELVQISLSPTSCTAFDRYKVNTAYRIYKGKESAEGSTRVRLTCKLQTKGKQTWTVVEFTRYD
jgi:hypothetical protein